MEKKQFIYIGIIAVCFLYTGSAYMSQFYRLMDMYDAVTVDIITSGYNYILQAAGIALYMFGLWKWPSLFRKKRLFIALLVSGAVFMAISQFSAVPMAVVITGYIFNLHIGLYFGFYLTMLADHFPLEHTGIGFGCAYAFGSLGTYLLSLLTGGSFLVSKSIIALYFIMIAITIALVYYGEDIQWKSMEAEDLKEASLHYLIPILVIMTFINVIGSNLYYSLPSANNVDWNLIRAFYSIGLIIAGYIIDKNRLIGEVCVAGSLAYPLITTALIGEGMTNTAVLSLSYFFRGFLTVYYVVSFVDIAGRGKKYIILASGGLLISRLTEGILSLVLMSVTLPAVYQLIISSFCFIPLLILIAVFQHSRYSLPVSTEKKLATYADKFSLTAREIEILECLMEGMTDAEISEKLFISKNTVRFHVSNLLKKTASSSRTDIVNSVNKM